MSELGNTPEAILARVTDIVQKHVPGAACELQAYKTEIGCGARDAGNSLHEVKWGLNGLNEWRVNDQARVLASLVAPRTRFQRS